jgi:hypothetical protein
LPFCVEPEFGSALVRAADPSADHDIWVFSFFFCFFCFTVSLGLFDFFGFSCPFAIVSASSGPDEYIVAFRRPSSRRRGLAAIPTEGKKFAGLAGSFRANSLKLLIVICHREGRSE